MANKKKQNSGRRGMIKEAAAPKVRKPRQATLAGMEDAKLDELHGLAEQFVEVRDQRSSLGGQLKALRDDLSKAMHAHGKVRYKHNGCEIIVVPGTDKVKVELAKEGEESEAVPF